MRHCLQETTAFGERRFFHKQLRVAVYAFTSNFRPLHMRKMYVTTGVFNHMNTVKFIWLMIPPVFTPLLAPNVILKKLLFEL